MEVKPSSVAMVVSHRSDYGDRVSFWSEDCKYCNHVLGCVCSPLDLERWGAAEHASKTEYLDRLKQEWLRCEAERNSRRPQAFGGWRHFPGDDDDEVRLSPENSFLVGPWGAWWRLWEIGRECRWCGHIRTHHTASCKNVLQSSIVDAAVLADIYGESTSDWHTMDSAKLRAEEITRNRN